MPKPKEPKLVSAFDKTGMLDCADLPRFSLTIPKNGCHFLHLMRSEILSEEFDSRQNLACD
jgi:hypothetical protein